MLFNNSGGGGGGEGLTIVEIVGWILIIFMLFHWFVKIVKWLGYKIGCP